MSDEEPSGVCPWCGSTTFIDLDVTRDVCYLWRCTNEDCTFTELIGLLLPKGATLREGWDGPVVHGFPDV